MAFAVTDYKAYGVDISEPVTKRAVQHLEMTITGLAADVDMDIGDQSGAFWTAAEADGTYGATATACKAVIADIETKAAHRISFFLKGVTDLKKLIEDGGTTAGDDYYLSGTTVMPEITIHTAEGLTSYKLHLAVALDDEERAVRAGF